MGNDLIRTLDANPDYRGKWVATHDGIVLAYGEELANVYAEIRIRHPTVRPTLIPISKYQGATIITA